MSPKKLLLAKKAFKNLLLYLNSPLDHRQLGNNFHFQPAFVSFHPALPNLDLAKHLSSNKVKCNHLLRSFCLNSVGKETLLPTLEILHHTERKFLIKALFMNRNCGCLTSVERPKSSLAVKALSCEATVPILAADLSRWIASILYY